MIKTLSLSLAFAAAAPAFAQEPGPEPELETAQPADPCVGTEDCGDAPYADMAGSDEPLVTGEVSLLSDYRFRGVSRSDEDPAVQAALTLTPGGGFYAGLRGTTLKGTDSFRELDPAFQDLGDVELDLYAGYGTQIGDGFEIDAGLMYYVFAGGDGPTDYFEPYASLSYLIGPVYGTLGAKYAPSQDAIGGEDMLYLFGQIDATIPFRPWSFSLQAGRQDWGAFGTYWTWSVGAEHHLRIEGLPDAYLGLRYVDTDTGLPNADAGLVASLRINF
jgi:uncharacterized protein (TIGR02001 family)